MQATLQPRVKATVAADCAAGVIDERNVRVTADAGLDGRPEPHVGGPLQAIPPPPPLLPPPPPNRPALDVLSTYLTPWGKRPGSNPLQRQQQFQIMSHHPPKKKTHLAPPPTLNILHKFYLFKLQDEDVLHSLMPASYQVRAYPWHSNSISHPHLIRASK